MDGSTPTIGLPTPTILMVTDPTLWEPSPGLTVSELLQALNGLPASAVEVLAVLKRLFQNVQSGFFAQVMRMDQMQIAPWLQSYPVIPGVEDRVPNGTNPSRKHGLPVELSQSLQTGTQDQAVALRIVQEI
jgi:hypothetical protein